MKVYEHGPKFGPPCCEATLHSSKRIEKKHGSLAATSLEVRIVTDMFPRTQAEPLPTLATALLTLERMLGARQLMPSPRGPLIT